MADSNPIGWILAGGGGTVVGSLVMAVIQSATGRSEARAHAADLITEAAGSLADRQAVMIDRLERQSDRQRRAVLTLTTLIEDELLPQLTLPAPQRTKLRAALTAVRQTL